MLLLAGIHRLIVEADGGQAGGPHGQGDAIAFHIDPESELGFGIAGFEIQGVVVVKDLNLRRADGSDLDIARSRGGDDTGNGRPGPGEDRRSGPDGRGMDTDVGGTTTSNPGQRGRPGSPPVATADTVHYTTVRGTMTYYVQAEILLVDPTGREVNRFTASSRQSGPFERGEFDGDPRILRLQDSEARFFDPAVFARQMRTIEGAVLGELAAAVATGTYDQVLAGIR